MKRSLLAWTILVLILMTNFTNCDIASNNGAFKAQSSLCGSLCDSGANADMLEIKLNIPDSPSNYVYPSSVVQFDLGGVCNEGGYSSNVVTWKLLNTSQTVIRESSVLGLNGVCHWGRFTLPINTGAALVGQHTLVVEILGISYNGEIASNSIVGRSMIYLNPQ